MRRILNPFHKIAGWHAFIAGLLVMAVTSFISGKMNVHLDGILDVHIGQEVTIQVAILENLINWLTLVLVFGILSVILNGLTFRFIDLTGIMAFTRIPFVLAPILRFIVNPDNMLNYVKYKVFGSIEEVMLTTSDKVGFIVFIIVTILITALSVVWLYNGFRVLSNSRGAKVNGLFVLGLILSEIVSKIFISLIIT